MSLKNACGEENDLRHRLFPASWLPACPPLSQRNVVSQLQYPQEGPEYTRPFSEATTCALAFGAFSTVRRTDSTCKPRHPSGTINSDLMRVIPPLKLACPDLVGPHGSKFAMDLSIQAIQFESTIQKIVHQISQYCALQAEAMKSGTALYLRSLSAIAQLGKVQFNVCRVVLKLIKFPERPAWMIRSISTWVELSQYVTFKLGSS
ncbi:hypothetical protein OKW32_000124 [Paraburkholderia youngii]